MGNVAFPRIMKKSTDDVIGPSLEKMFSWMFKSGDLARKGMEAWTWRLGFLSHHMLTFGHRLHSDLNGKCFITCSTFRNHPKHPVRIVTA